LLLQFNTLNMRFLTLLIVPFLLSGIGNTTVAQDVLGGTVKYQRLANFGIEAEGEYDEFKKTLPKSRITNFILYYTDETYQFVENSKENEALTDMMKKAMYFAGTWGKPRVTLMKYYHNPQKILQIKQTEFMTRLFREEFNMKKIKWKMGTASKEILGYTCMQAQTELDGKKILAWFTPDIPISAGPERYYGLPGLMLEVNVNQGEVVWLANSIDPSIPSKDLLAKPKEGKKVKPDQYMQIQEGKIAEWERAQEMKTSDKAVRLK